MKPAASYIKATSVAQAVSLAEQCPGSFRYLAGGTDLMVNKFQGNDDARFLIDLSGIAALTEINCTESRLVIGPMVTLDDLTKHPDILRVFPVVAEAAKSVGSPTIRNTATIGGNLLCENRCSYYNQSEWWREAAGHCLKSAGDTCLASGGKKHCFAKFVSDMAVVLISIGALIEVHGRENNLIPLENIYSGDGIHPRTLTPAAVINNIVIPINENCRSVYKKLRKRETLDFTSLTTAVTVSQGDRIRIVMGGVHAKPVIVDGSTTDNLDILVNEAVSNTRVIDNDTYSRTYRKDMIPVFLNRSFNELQLT